MAREGILSYRTLNSLISLFFLRIVPHRVIHEYDKCLYSWVDHPLMNRFLRGPFGCLGCTIKFNMVCIYLFGNSAICLWANIRVRKDLSFWGRTWIFRSRAGSHSRRKRSPICRLLLSNNGKRKENKYVTLLYWVELHDQAALDSPFCSDDILQLWN